MADESGEEAGARGASADEPEFRGPASPFRYNAHVLRGFDRTAAEPPAFSPGVDGRAASRASTVLRLQGVGEEDARNLVDAAGAVGGGGEAVAPERSSPGASSGGADPGLDVFLYLNFPQLEGLRTRLLAAPGELPRLAEEVIAALDAYHRVDFEIDCRGRFLRCGSRPLIMGIVNCTPDSFWEGSRALAADAVEATRKMAAAGADVVDVGGESTRPGSDPVAVEEEIDRVVPVIEAIVEEIDLPVSIDTRKAAVARAALEAGASMVNDVSGLAHDPGLGEVVADAGVPVVLMHMRGEPSRMNERARYDDVVGEVIRELRQAQARAAAAGISREATLVDPGIGFAKTAGQSLSLLRHLQALRSLGRPIVVGPSRKSFIGQVLELPASERLEGTAAAVAVSVTGGAHVVRVHDVAEMRRVADLAAAVRTEGAGWIS